MSSCEDCLELATREVKGDDGSSKRVPDDVELICNCRFHWQCLMGFTSRVLEHGKCPACGEHIVDSSHSPSSSTAARSSSISTDRPPIMAKYTNEDGLNPALNLVPHFMEEAHVQGESSVSPGRTLHIMCREGDSAGIVNLLTKLAEDAHQELPLDEQIYLKPEEVAEHQKQGRRREEKILSDVLLYADPFKGGTTALHIAVENERVEVAWLLLWLISWLKAKAFPSEMVKSFQADDLPRLGLLLHKDIRWMLDFNRRTANDVATKVGGASMALVRTGVLLPGSSG